MSRLLFALTLALALSACASSSEYRIAEETGLPVLSRNDVTVYQTREQVGDDYEVLGYLKPSASTARSSYGNADPQVEEAKRQAARIGANGVLVVTAEDLNADARIRQAMGTNTSFSRRQFVAIYVGPLPPGVVKPEAQE